MKNPLLYTAFCVVHLLFQTAKPADCANDGGSGEQTNNSPSLPSESDLFVIEGKLVYVKSQETKSIDGIRTKISADGEEHFGFLRFDRWWIVFVTFAINYNIYLHFIHVFFSSEDRESFTISGVPAGSYLIEVYHPEFIFEIARVDVSSKGKFRARRPDTVDNSAQNQLAYPLRLKLLRKASYFQAKEAWRLTDMLMNPMVSDFSLQAR